MQNESSPDTFGRELRSGSSRFLKRQRSIIYSILTIPDTLLGLTSYRVTACLAGLGPQNRRQTHPLMPIGMGVKLLADAALAGKLTVDSCRKYRAISVWSLLTAAATFAAIPLAIP
jgi:hypothetical protein